MRRGFAGVYICISIPEILKYTGDFTMLGITAALALVLAVSAPGHVAARTFTVFNHCPFTIWYVTVPTDAAASLTLAGQARCVHRPQRGYGNPRRPDRVSRQNGFRPWNTDAQVAAGGRRRLSPPGASTCLITGKRAEFGCEVFYFFQCTHLMLFWALGSEELRLFCEPGSELVPRRRVQW